MLVRTPAAELPRRSRRRSGTRFNVLVSPTEVKASTVEGTTGDDVILYGEVYHWAYSGGHWWVAHSPGICVFSPGGGGDCDISTAIKHEEWTDSTYVLYGDASGGYGEDYIYPADMCTTGTINCNGGYWIGMADVSSSARFYLRGDRTSTTSGADDQIWGWDNGDEIRGGGGSDHIWGGDGSDYISGDAGVDFLYGQDCEAGVTETISGGSGADYIYGYDSTTTNGGTSCPRSLSGNSENDVIYGGPGNDQLFGGTENDTLVRNDGSDDYCWGGDPTTYPGDYCSSSCDGHSYECERP
jgi:Ca2+-binding RTX toxin-like protein